MTASRSLPLIRAKLFSPPVGRFFVHRPRLSEQLSRGLSGALILVCAPAGYGKTTLVGGWIERMISQGEGGSALKCAWLALDSRDNDLNAFMRYFVAAIRTLFPEACRETQELLGAPVQPRLALLSATLSNEIAALSEPFVIVLDDYSAIKNEAIHGLVNELLRYRPQPLRLILIARNDPPLALAQLRARGTMTEIRISDLRFNREEIAGYLERSTPAHASQAMVEQLDQMTEGWIAGLNLTVRSLGVSESSGGKLSLRPDAAAYVADDLFDEVLSAQPRTIRAFLLKTAILDRYNGALAAAVIASDDPQYDVRECVSAIARADLFVTSLDDRREWYRYHHLFQNLLYRRLLAEYGPEEVNRLHERAAAWFGGQGLVDEALHHALAAGNLDLAAQLIEQGIGDALNREDPLSLERRLHLLPEEFISNRPGLLLAKAWVLQFSWQLAAQARVLGQIEALLDSSDEASLTWEGSQDLGPLRGQIALMRAQQAHYASQPKRAMAFAEEALALLPQSWVYARGGAVLYSALSAWAAGEGEGLANSLLDRFESLADQTDTYALRHLLAMCFITVNAGQLERARHAAEAMLHLGQRGGSALMQNWARYFLGLVHLERNELTDAEPYLSALVAHPYTTFMAALHDGFVCLALVHQARGDIPAAMRTVRTLGEVDLERVGMEDARTRSLRAGLQLRQGNIEDAGRWADAFTSPVPDGPLLWMETPHLTRARILIQRNQDSDVPTALEILDTVAALAGQTHNTTHQIRVHALRALALEAMGRPEDAMHALRQAVVLSRPGGFVRVFVDLGPPMKRMLQRLAGQGHETAAIRRLLDAFPDAPSGPEGLRWPVGVGRSSGRGSQRLIEPLTARELEVLELLWQRLPDKEIARKLVISPATVKRHTANIYDKLGVNRRADAVAAAESLGILSPH